MLRLFATVYTILARFLAVLKRAKHSADIIVRTSRLPVVTHVHPSAGRLRHGAPACAEVNDEPVRGVREDDRKEAEAYD